MNNFVRVVDRPEPTTITVIGSEADLGTRCLEAAQSSSHAIELRGDLLHYGIEDLRLAVHKIGSFPLLLTLRMKQEGGEWAGDESRLPFIEGLLEDVDAVDIERASKIRGRVVASAEAVGVAVVHSYHNFQYTPELDELRDIVKGCRDAGATRTKGFVKVVTQVNDTDDIRTLRRLADEEYNDRDLIIFGMGGLATHTRFTFPLQSLSMATYACMPGRQVAPGQLENAVLDRVFNLDPNYRALQQ